MQIQLLSCDAKKPDKRAIAKALETYGEGMDSYSARESAEFLLDGSPVDMEVDPKTMSSAFRALRKLDIDYEIIED